MELKLDRKLYSAAAVGEAVEAFAELAQISLSQGDKRWFHLSFEKIDPEFGETLADEFANYALGLTIEGREA